MEPEFSFWFPETASPAFWPKDFLDVVSHCPDDGACKNSLGLGLSGGGSRVGLANDGVLSLLEGGLPGTFSTAQAKDSIVLTESQVSRRIQPLVKSARARMVCKKRWKQVRGRKRWKQVRGRKQKRLGVEKRARAGGGEEVTNAHTGKERKMDEDELRRRKRN
jgi:hypothetical protein